MRFPLLAVPFFLAGCAQTESSADPCSILGDDKLGEIMKAPVGKKDLTGPRDMGDETVSTCDIDFADGQWLTITLAHRDTPIDDAGLSRYTRRNSEWSAKHGFPVFYGDGEKDLEAFPEPDRRVHLRVGKNAGQGYTGSFPSNTGDKLGAMLTAIAK